jgi:hypothetical protein
MPSYRAPRSTNWSVLATDNEADQDQAKRAREELSQTLLASLKMEHIVVLAGSGCSLAAHGPSMGDLWEKIVGEKPNEWATKIAGKVGYDLSKTNIESFLSRIESYQQIHEDTDVEAFHNLAKDSIHLECTGFLESADLGAHEMFVHRLSRRRSRDQRLKIFTTNYDLCFERATSRIGGVAIDGFSFMAPRRYDPRYFDYDIIRRNRIGENQGNYLEGVILLYKLHGSVNWERRGNEIFETTKPAPDKACLIYPASGKYQQSYSQPYLESVSQYLSAIREPNTCVLIVGFGFNDDHLSEPLLAAARSNPHLRLVIVDPSLETKLAQGTGNHFQNEFATLSQRGEDIWLLNTNFNDFAELIPDLKSLTPAERLMKAVQGIQTKE